MCADPHFTGLDGSRYDYMANPDRVVALISDRTVQLNSRFIRYGNTSSTVLGPTCLRMCDHTVRLHPNGTILVGESAALLASKLNASQALVVSPAFSISKLSRNTVRVHIGSWRMSVQMNGRYINIFAISHLDKNDSHVHGAFGITGHPDHHLRKKELCQPRNEGACELPGKWQDYELTQDSSDLCSSDWTYKQFDGSQCTAALIQQTDKLQQRLEDMQLAASKYSPAH
jgi:hypothetical protein